MNYALVFRPKVRDEFKENCGLLRSCLKTAIALTLLKLCDRTFKV
jgi:hypothetical protein